MKAKVLGAAKAVAPFLLSLAYVGIDAAFGSPIDKADVKTIVAGLVTGLAVYFVPNLKAAS